MFKLVSTNIENFRVLRDIKIEFSTDREKPVTIIRAENGYGKTTFLNAFQWVTGGEAALGINYRFSPIDWPEDNRNGSTCTTKVELLVKVIDTEFPGQAKLFRIVRTRSETIDKNNNFKSNRDEELQVFSRTKEGDKEVLNPEQWIQSKILPKEELKTFYVDGDFAESFIYDPNVAPGERSKNISDAIRSLLGMVILENAETHLTTARKKFEKEAAKHSGGGKLTELVEEAEELDALMDEIQEEIDSLQTKKTDAAKNENFYNNKLLEALKNGAGNKEELGRKLKKLQEHFKKIPKDRLDKHKALCNSFSSTELAKEIISKGILATNKKLRELEKNGTIPDTLPEVIRDRIKKGKCICGASIKKGTPAFEELQSKLSECEHDEAQVQILTHLHHRINSWKVNLSDESKKESSLMMERYSRVNETFNQEDELTREINELETMLKDIPDSDLQQIRKDLETAKQALAELTHDLNSKREIFAQKKGASETLQKELSTFTAKNEKSKKALSKTEAASDLLKVVNETLEELQTDVVVEVSETMNEIFKKIIFGADDDDQSTLIVGAEIITDDKNRYVVKVRGANDTTLDIAQAVNGASRRALTLAFVLALTFVSSKVAPLVIDTPLGMSSGHVRKRMAEAAINYSSQLILLITRDELNGVANLIEDNTDKHYTLTNTSYYPTDVKNKPKQSIKGIEAIVCQCGPNEHCETCELTKVS